MQLGLRCKRNLVLECIEDVSLIRSYKDFEEVLRSVKLAGLASEVARLRARFVIKDASKADD